MRHKLTPRTLRIVEELQSLATRAEGQLHHASEAARAEWNAFRMSWPSEHELRQGVLGVSDDALEMMVGKVRRFHDILCELAGRLGATSKSEAPLRRAVMEPFATSDAGLAA
jgi:hypothetical protein